MKIGGIRVDDITWDELIDRVGRAIRENRKITIAYLNVHVWNMAGKYPSVKEFLEKADVVYCDGKGIQFGAAILGMKIRERFTGAFFIDDLVEIMAERGWSGFVVGGKEGVAERACDILVERFPHFGCKGTHHGYIKGMEDRVVKMVNEVSPHILFVGMGTPQQEEFVLKYRDSINVPVVWCVGALFDYVAGVQKKAPRWVSKSGFEWLFRLMSDPGRLWKRYLIGNTRFMFDVLKRRLKGE